MTKPIHRSKVLRWLVLAIGFSTVNGLTYGAGTKEQIMTVKEMTLWQIVDYLGSHFPLRRELVEQLFGSSLKKMESSNQYFTFWSGNGVALQNGMRVSRIVLAEHNDDKQYPGMITLNVSDKCLTLDEIKNRYGDLAIVSAPRGRSEDEETTYEAKAAWGKLTFGFAERNPACVSSVGIGPKK